MKQQVLQYNTRCTWFQSGTTLQSLRPRHTSRSNFCSKQGANDQCGAILCMDTMMYRATLKPPAWHVQTQIVTTHVIKSPMLEMVDGQRPRHGNVTIPARKNSAQVTPCQWLVVLHSTQQPSGPGAAPWRQHALRMEPPVPHARRACQRGRGGRRRCLGRSAARARSPVEQHLEDLRIHQAHVVVQVIHVAEDGVQDALMVRQVVVVAPLGRRRRPAGCACTPARRALRQRTIPGCRQPSGVCAPQPFLRPRMQADVPAEQGTNGCRVMRPTLSTHPERHDQELEPILASGHLSRH